MKKVILITLLIGMISSCTTNEERERLERDYPIVGKITSADGIGDRNIRTYLIDSCEYVGYINMTNSDILTHKGNCKNPIHIYKK